MQRCTIRSTRHDGVLALHLSVEVSLGDRGYGEETDDRVLCDVTLTSYDVGEMLMGENLRCECNVPDEVMAALLGKVTA